MQAGSEYYGLADLGRILVSGILVSGNLKARGFSWVKLGRQIACLYMVATLVVLDEFGRFAYPFSAPTSQQPRM
jgi:hypothetical protein